MPTSTTERRPSAAVMAPSSRVLTSWAAPCDIFLDPPVLLRVPSTAAFRRFLF
jgi:hypothetical protein